jgi:hypothetical protein
MSLFKILLSMVLLLSGCSVSAVSGAGAVYHGQVIDAETNKPIEGAVFVVVWSKRPRVTMDGPEYFHNAKEVLTDIDGKFSVDASPGIDWDPFTVVRERAIAIFKPGYAPYPMSHVKETTIDETNEAFRSVEGVVIKLPRLRNKRNLEEFTGPIDMLLPVYPV